VKQINMEKSVVFDDDEPPLLRGSVLPTTQFKSRRSKWTQASESKVVSNLDRTELFRKTYFPDVKKIQWNDWHWQLANRITTLAQLERILQPTPTERQALEHAESQFPFSITPYYLSLIDPRDLQDPLRKTVVPTVNEALVSHGESMDPLHEEHTSPVPGIVHRYPDRALFLVTDFCSVYCRYCTRSRLVGGHTEALQSHWDAAIDYIRKTPVIRDVVVSGGDPLTLSDDMLEYLLSKITSIPHVEMVRIGTKVPLVLPQRITPALVSMLKRYKPLYMSVHCTHPNEITKEATVAFNRLADSGIVMGSQTVLLKGVNDTVQTMKDLYHRLLMVRVKPYYLFQCDPIAGSAHFRTTVEKGKQLIQGLRGFTSGYAIPQYVIDTPGGGGKVPILPDYEIGHDEDNMYLRNYEGKVFAYPDRAQEGTETLC
jgi:lysine 2,3-aminomutase